MADERVSTPADAAPKYIGRYRVVDRLGKGMMGVVYNAEDEATGRRVAVKVMTADLREEPEVRERFEREARVTAQLTHPNIVTLFDFGEDHGHPFIVMELLQGLSLTDHLKTKWAQSIEAKLDLMRQACAGLQHAHAHGVVHRDVKPNNIVVLNDGTLKIVDFGIARIAASSLTMSGFLVGTPEYMSPEQAQGREIDGRSDLFSVAGVFYYMLTGHGPFSVGNLPRVIQAVINEDPAPLTEADAPEALRRIVMKGLAKAPADRYQQCAEMLADLDKLRRSREATVRRVVQAGIDRFRDVAALVEKHAAAAQTSPDEALAQLRDEFPLFAVRSINELTPEAIERADPAGALDRLKLRHNQEMAAVAGLHQDAADTLRKSEGDAPAGQPPPVEEEPKRSFWGRLGGRDKA